MNTHLKFTKIHNSIICTQFGNAIMSRFQLPHIRYMLLVFVHVQIHISPLACINNVNVF